MITTSRETHARYFNLSWTIPTPIESSTMYSPASVTTVAWYNPATKLYKVYITGVPPPDFTLNPGTAYWVYVNGNGTFSYTP